MDPESDMDVMVHKAVLVYTYNPIPPAAETEGLGFRDHRRVYNRTCLKREKAVNKLEGNFTLLQWTPSSGDWEAEKLPPYIFR